MPFTALTDEQIATGEPTSQPLFQRIKDDFDDHESRLADLEAGSASSTPLAFEVFGKLDSSHVDDEVVIMRVAQNMTLTGCRLLVGTAGSSGTLQVDIKYKRAAGAWTTILSAAMSSAYTEGDYDVVSGALAVTDIQAGDLLRLDLQSVQTDMVNFGVYIENGAAA